MIEAGDLLVAPPMMPDPRFSESVLLVANHTESGSVAFAINKPTSFTVNDVLPEIGIEANIPIPLYCGGPVKTSGIWLLHDPDWYTENTMAINDYWSVTSSIEMFYNFADGDVPRYHRFVHGMSSWSGGQLAMEIKGEFPWSQDSSWLSIPSQSPEWCFEQSEAHLWESATETAAKQAVDAWL